MRLAIDRQAKPVPFAVFWIVVLLLFGLAGCASTEHARYDGGDTFPCATARAVATDRQARPAAPGPTLHILEFDDQGWPFPPRGAMKDASPSYRIDCAIDDIAARVNGQRKVLIFLYVHGWHHTAAPGDPDLERFRQTLREQHKRHGSDRDVIGIYVGWNGNTLPVTGLGWTTFYSRKNAAHHIAEGSVRELFARLQALRNRWNRNTVAGLIGVTTCNRARTPVTGPDCPIRTVMTGHSFGAWILYASTAPYIMQTLANSSATMPSVPGLQGEAEAPKEAPDTERERGIADLILLINPAFEATRYNAVFNAAHAYSNGRYEPPLLVSVTSAADDKTGMLFPIARTFNTILQHRAPTDMEREAMRNTHGHMERYLSHRLELVPPSPSAEGPGPCDDFASASQADEERLRHRYVCALRRKGADASALPPLERRFCGGLRLTWLPNSSVDPFSVVWNIRTYANVIPDHSRIHEPPMEYLVAQLYEDVGKLPRFDLTAGPGPDCNEEAGSPMPVPLANVGDRHLLQGRRP